MGKAVICPVCSREVPENLINTHLDKGCQEIQPTTPKASSSAPKLAPIFASQLGKRGTDTRPSNLKTPKASKRASSPDIITVDDQDEVEQPIKKRTKVENIAPIFTHASGAQKVTSNKIEVSETAPLAERLRPRVLSDFVGQEHLTGGDSMLLSIIESKAMGSMILWGPPGCGKTTLARLLSTTVDASFKELSATNSGINDVKAVFDEAKRALKFTGRRTILFMDEIQRFNKAQQDIFLPYIENGWVTLIGATTENPSFKLNSALLSRCRVFVLERLSDADIETIIQHAIERVSSKPKPEQQIETQQDSEPLFLSEARSSPTLVDSSQHSVKEASQQESAQPEQKYRDIAPEVMKTLVNLSMGDARTALSLLELVLTSPAKSSDAAVIGQLKRTVVSRYDRSGEDRYNMISALHKSMRGSDGGAALYWLARMLTQGEDPVYIARRCIVFASEDIGLADNQALPLAIATHNAVTIIGLPECRINLAHCVAYLSEAKKSTRSYEAYNRAEELAKSDETAPVPMHLRNAPTKMMKDMKFSEGYLYNPAYRHPVHQEYLPLMLSGEKILKEEGDLEGKLWDEPALRQWEWRNNGGADWEGRKHANGNEK